MALPGGEGRLHLLAARQFLDQDGRRAHRPAGDDLRAIGYLVQRQEADGAVLLQRRAGHELADIGIAPAARAQNGRADGQIVEIVNRDLAHHRAMVSIGTNGWSSPKQDGPNTASASGVRMISGTATAMTETRWP